MNPKLRIHAWSAAFCAVMTGLDWYDIVHYSRSLGIQQEGIAPFIFAYPLGIAVAMILAVSLVCRSGLRASAEGGWRLCPLVFLYALPLLWVGGSTFTSIETDGTVATHYRGFGASRHLFWIAVTVLVLVQLRDRRLRVSRRLG